MWHHRGHLLQFLALLLEIAIACARTLGAFLLLGKLLLERLLCARHVLDHLLHFRDRALRA